MAAHGLILLLLVVFRAVTGEVYYVDNTKTGSSTTGTSSNPFAKIQDCVDAIEGPGDECKIIAGRYHEQIKITGKHGSPDKPILIYGSPETRPVIDGTVEIKPISAWEKLDATKSIYSAKISADISQLFVDGEMMTNARWPNSLWSDRSIFNGSLWAGLDKKSRRGKIVNKGNSLADTNINMTGAVAVLNIGSFCTFNALVAEHTAGSNSFTYEDTFGKKVRFKPSISRYFLEDKLELLDQPEEWFYDKRTGTLHVWTKNGDSPASHELRGKVQTYAISITDSSNLVLKDLDFFGTTLEAKSIDMMNTIDALTFQSLNFKFPSYSKRMLGVAAPPEWTRIIAFVKRNDVPKYGTFQVRNCTFFGSDGVALEYRGLNAVITNNLFEFNDWSGADMTKASGGSRTVSSKGIGDVFVRNTLRYNGASAGYRPGDRSTIQLNHVYGQCWGFIQNDGSSIQVTIGQQPSSQVSQNWVHSTPKYGIRFDGQPPRIGTRGTMQRNVVFKSGGIMVKGDYHRVLNNLAFDRRKGPSGDGQGNGCTFCVLKYVRANPRMINNNTVVIGNAADVANGGKNLFDRNSTFWPLAGIVVKDNVFGNVRDEIMDADNFDFRPKSESQYNHQNAGPYTYQAKRASYWIPGRKMYKACTPVPPNGSKTVLAANRDAVMWLNAQNARSHDVYFGIDREVVKNADKTSSVYLKSTGSKTRNIVYLDGKLEDKKTYYWRVDAVISKDIIYKGDVWSFTTK